MSSTSTSAKCNSGFEWMTNSNGQDPCTIAAWLIQLCEDPSSSLPANLAPLDTSYSAPNGSSATRCSCSWAMYNNIEACTICQNGNPKSYSEWTSNCNLLGITSTSSYWPSNTSFSSKTKLPVWSIFNPTEWSSGTFNANEAQSIDNQNLPDVTDASASQPSTTFASSSSGSSSSSSKSSVGAIVGGVIGGLAALALIALIAWCLIRKRRREGGGDREKRQRHSKDSSAHFDLNAEGGPLPSPTTSFRRPLSLVGHGGIGGNNPLAAHLNPQAPNPINPYSNPQQLQTRQNSTFNTEGANPYGVYPAPTNARRPSNSTNRSDTNIVTNIERMRASKESIPTVADQMDEKRRLRAAREAPSSFPAAARTHSRTGSNSNPSEDGSNSNANTVSISHSANRFFANRHAGEGGESMLGPSGVAMSPTSPLSPNRRSQLESQQSSESQSPTSPNRRNSLIKSWRRRRTQRVMNPSSDSHIIPPDSNVSALPLNSTVAGEGQTTTPGEVVAQIPGARVPNARDRENPPPGYPGGGT